jgi:phosphatidylinositol alpha 1,6-mannosyltransferase
MRIAIIAESFLPHMNGVTHSLLRVMEHLTERGDDMIVVAARSGRLTPAEHAGVRVDQVPSFTLPRYPSVRVAPGGSRRLMTTLEEFRPDVVHLASPFVLGWRGLLAAQSLAIPTVAVYQTEIPAYAARYGIPYAEELLWQHVDRIHQGSTLTLAPSSAAIAQLEARGIDRVRLWVRGVDSERFTPARRSEEWRRSVAPNGERLIGYVGRLAAEKQLEDLVGLSRTPGTRLVIVGDGPIGPSLRKAMPDAHFTGFLGGDELATVMASLDVFVHPGESETFCQTIQEAMASGVPVVATGRGGPLDLVDSSRTGWVYTPGHLDEMENAVRDLVGDDGKRAAFGRAARTAVQARTWKSVTGALVGHYSDAIELASGSSVGLPRRRRARRG